MIPKLYCHKVCLPCNLFIDAINRAPPPQQLSLLHFSMFHLLQLYLALLRWIHCPGRSRASPKAAWGNSAPALPRWRAGSCWRGPLMAAHRWRSWRTQTDADLWRIKVWTFKLEWFDPSYCWVIKRNSSPHASSTASLFVALIILFIH